MRALILLLALAGASYAQGWSALSSTTMQSVCPANNFGGQTYNFNDFCYGAIRAWGSAVMDTKRNRLVLWGGGHSDYYGNEVYALSLTGTPAWSRLTDPSPIASPGTCVAALSDGNPNSRHPFDQLTYIEHLDKMFSFGGAVACSDGNNFKDTWLFDMATNTWTRKDTVNGTNLPTALSGPPYGYAKYDRDTRLVYLIWQDTMWSYNADTNTYVRLNTNAHVPYSSTGVIDPKRRKMYFFGHEYQVATPLVYVTDIDTNTGTYLVSDITSSTSGCSTLALGDYPGLVYDPIMDKIVGYPGTGNDVYIFDPVAKTCSPHAFSSGPTAPVSFISTLGRFNYSAALGKYVLVNDATNNAYTFTLNPTAIHGLGSSTLTCIDKDGDGYGVGCTNPDADDLDATVHTAAEGTTKYGTFTKFLNRLGYNPTRIWYIATTGNDGTGAVNNSSLPFASWTPINGSLAAGDMVIVRGGTYTTLQMTPINGTSGNPIIFLSYPGERAILSTSSSKPTIDDRSYHIFDGIKFQSGACLDAGTTDGAPSSTFHNNQYKNLEGTGCQWGFAAFNGLNDIVIEDSSFHDNIPGIVGEHGIYIGSRALTSTNVLVRRNLLYGNERNGIHMNGRMYNAHVEQNWAYNNGLSGLDMQNGVSRSYLRANTSFANNSGSMTIYNYGSGQCTLTGDGTGDICPYDQTGNLIENNTFYSTGFHVDGTANIGQYAIKVANCSPSETGNLGGNTFRNNIFVNPGSIRYAPVVYVNGDQSGTGCTNLHVNSTTAAYLSTSTFTSNVFKNNDGSVSTKFIAYGIDPSFGYTGHDCTAAASLTTLSGCTNSDPLFTAASPSYYNSVSSFDFRLQASSPAKAAGTTLGAPLFDSTGTVYSLSTPNIGAFESAASGGATGGGSRSGGRFKIGGKSSAH